MHVQTHYGRLPTSQHTPCCGSNPVLTSSGGLSRWIAPRSQTQENERIKNGWGESTSIRFLNNKFTRQVDGKDQKIRSEQGGRKRKKRYYKRKRETLVGQNQIYYMWYLHNIYFFCLCFSKLQALHVGFVFYRDIIRSRTSNRTEQKMYLFHIFSQLENQTSLKN